MPSLKFMINQIVLNVSLFYVATLFSLLFLFNLYPIFFYWKSPYLHSFPPIFYKISHFSQYHNLTTTLQYYETSFEHFIWPIQLSSGVSCDILMTKNTSLNCKTDYSQQTKKRKKLLQSNYNLIPKTEIIIKLRLEFIKN